MGIQPSQPPEPPWAVGTSNVLPPRAASSVRIRLPPLDRPKQVEHEVRRIERICAVKCLWTSREHRALCFKEKVGFKHKDEVRRNLAPYGIEKVPEHHRVTLEELRAKGVRCFFWIDAEIPLAPGDDNGHKWPHGGL